MKKKYFEGTQRLPNVAKDNDNQGFPGLPIYRGYLNHWP
jgi:hypothetical protein